MSKRQDRAAEVERAKREAARRVNQTKATQPPPDWKDPTRFVEVGRMQGLTKRALGQKASDYHERDRKARKLAKRSRARNRR